MATVTEAVKESLLGKEAPPSLSSESRLSFLKNSKRGEDGELYMDEEDFINAIAPAEEDYVSSILHSLVPADSVRFRSTKSSAHSMAYCSVSQTARSAAKSQCPSGLPLTTS